MPGLGFLSSLLYSLFNSVVCIDRACRLCCLYNLYKTNCFTDNDLKLNSGYISTVDNLLFVCRGGGRLAVWKSQGPAADRGSAVGWVCSVFFPVRQPSSYPQSTHRGLLRVSTEDVFRCRSSPPFADIASEGHRAGMPARRNPDISRGRASPYRGAMSDLQASCSLGPLWFDFILRPSGPSSCPPIVSVVATSPVVGWVTRYPPSLVRGGAVGSKAGGRVEDEE